MDLDTKGLDRRELGRIAMRYGWTSTLFALAGMTGTVTATKLAKAADETAAKRKPAKFTWKFGASGFNESNLKIQKSGQLFFAKDIEERTDGEIRIEFIGSNQICGQLDCVQKTQLRVDAKLRRQRPLL